MKVEDVIRKAIEGGYSLTGDNSWNGEKIHSIKKSGSRWLGRAKPKEVRDDEIYFWRDDAVTIRFKEDGIIVSLNDLYVDPTFWQSLGKTLRWERLHEMLDGGQTEGWRWQWVRFIDHLAEGKTAEEFFGGLN